MIHPSTIFDIILKNNFFSTFHDTVLIESSSQKHILVTGVAENQTDITIPCLVITSDRQKLVDFTNPLFSHGLRVWVKKPEVEFRSYKKVYLVLNLWI